MNKKEDCDHRNTNATRTLCLDCGMTVEEAIGMSIAEWDALPDMVITFPMLKEEMN